MPFIAMFFSHTKAAELIDHDAIYYSPQCVEETQTKQSQCYYSCKVKQVGLPKTTHHDIRRFLYTKAAKEVRDCNDFLDQGTGELVAAPLSKEAPEVVSSKSYNQHVTYSGDQYISVMESSGFYVQGTPHPTDYQKAYIFSQKDGHLLEQKDTLDFAKIDSLNRFLQQRLTEMDAETHGFYAQEKLFAIDGCDKCELWIDKDGHLAVEIYYHRLYQPYVILPPEFVRLQQ